ncbi:unnamed protein product [Oppiella nova]|uniref:Alpha-mannosidase n=1 Tax=Oppiella nova TaxID=334625 RepID=A0A7R9QKR5_9ACAR|nr:unnamed protein product [Oppiella nova]CAG2167933.1 unnamed protein product [Oppiella nova]
MDIQFVGISCVTIAIMAFAVSPVPRPPAQASLFAQFNFDGLFFSRLDYEDRDRRVRDKELEMVWTGSDDLTAGKSDIFTGAMYLGYGNTTAFCWDLVGCKADSLQNDPIIDDPDSEDYNVDRVVDQFVAYMRSYAAMYATNHAMYPLGEDFQYMSGNSWFKNTDKLIRYVNAKQDKIRLLYSTPACYLKSLHEANHTFPTKRDDFFPYASDPHAYWTGYFTSRPALKRYERVGNNFLQICKQLDVLSGATGANEPLVTPLREWMGVMQHHDAVAGTEKQHVADDYALKLYKSIAKCQHVVADGLSKLSAKQVSAPKVEPLFCEHLNVSACPVTESDDPLLTVTVYNPMGRAINHTVRLPVTNKMFHVVDPAGQSVDSHVVPIPAPVLSIPERVSKARDELVFEAEVPALGFATYLVHQNSVNSGSVAPVVRKITDSFSAKANSFDVMFDKTGKVLALRLKSGQTVGLTQDFAYYKSMPGNNTRPELRASGAYVFRPDGQSIAYNNSEFEAKVVETPALTEVHQKINSYISQVIRVHRDRDYVEFDYVCGPIPVLSDGVGKEIIARFATNLTTNAVFYTDSNGRQLMRRERNRRPTWPLTVTEPIAGNYYPVNTRIALKDELQALQMTVLNDRAQGGSSMTDGAIELMIHRRTLFDDRFGVNEAINETGVGGQGLVIRGQMRVMLSSIETSAEQHRELAQRLYMEPLITFGRYNGTQEEYLKDYKTKYSALTQELPKNVHLLTLEEWTGSNGTVVLLRLEHFYQSNESRSLSAPVVLSLDRLFAPFVISEAAEQTLGANEGVDALKNRFKFNVKTDEKDLFVKNVLQFSDELNAINVNELTVTLNPMEIKTFIIKITPKSDL